MKPEHVELAVSIFNLDALQLGRDLEALEEAGCPELLLPIGDGLMAPLCCGAPLISRVHARFRLGLHALLTVHHPDRQIEGFLRSGCSRLTLQLEQCRHPHRLLHRIRAAGISPGVALCPGTPLIALDYLLELTDHVVLMTHEPAAAAAGLSPVCLDRIAILRENIHHRKLPVRIGMYGGFTAPEAKQAIAKGVSYLLLEAQALEGKSDAPLSERFVALRQCLTGSAVAGP